MAVCQLVFELMIIIEPDYANILFVFGMETKLSFSLKFATHLTILTSF